jgi:hypothetical protein
MIGRLSVVSRPTSTSGVLLFEHGGNLIGLAANGDVAVLVGNQPSKVIRYIWPPAGLSPTSATTMSE